MKKKKTVWQRHHITYIPEVTVIIRRKCHWCITLLQRYKDFTPNEKRALRYIIKHKPVCKLKPTTTK